MLRSAPPSAWCAADPGSILLREWVPALRRTAEVALRRVRDTENCRRMLRTGRGFARKLPMTSRQNQSTMDRIVVPGPPGIPESDLPARKPHEITETHRLGIGRIVCVVG